MDESLRSAARVGDVEELYRLIEGNGNLLRQIDEVEFADTPLHIAAAAGCTDFAMEIMRLKPSFARKLNRQGLSPVHLAVRNGHNELVLRLLEVNKDLARVHGKKGETPLHYLITKEENGEDLARILEACPESIRDVTTENQTALHIAAEIKRLDVLQVLLEMLRKTEYCQEVVNRKDKHGKTALYIAARNNQHKMLKLLLKCKADKHAPAKDGSTALSVAKENNCTESIKILRGCFLPRVSQYTYVLEKKIVKCVGKATATIFHNMDSISSEDRNALLVILGLLLTATFQASLSPPGGVQAQQEEDNNTSKSVKLLGNYDYSNDYDEPEVGTSVMNQTSFVLFYVPTCAVFMVAFFLTLGLLKPFPRGFRTSLQILLSFLAICFNESIYVIAPIGLAPIVLSIFSILMVMLMLLMCISHRVSRISVLILGCWLSTSPLLVGYESDKGIPGGGIFVLLCWLFIFLFIDFLEGIILVLECCLLVGIGASELYQPILVVAGCWLILRLFRFCIRLCNERCPIDCVNVLTSFF